MKKLIQVACLILLASAALAQFTPTQYRTRTNARNCGKVGLPATCDEGAYRAAPGANPAVTIWPDNASMTAYLSQKQINTDYAAMVDEQAEEIAALYRSADLVKRRQICGVAGVPNPTDSCF